MTAKLATAGLDSLYAALGYRFSDERLLKRALTHSSARERRRSVIDNERLEFLGDRVLGLVVAELLLERYADSSEGELALQFNRLVRKEMCALIAQQDLQLGRHLILGKSGERGNVSILGDACEAVLGALFLDGGFSEARRVIRALWDGHLSDEPAIPSDPKSSLQEWVQGRGLPLPQYVERSREGPDHAPVFVAEVQVQGVKPAQGTGASKRAAEQAAAEAMLMREGIWTRAENV
ncbi:MAG: ribonuclease III [Hyphomicrobiales bacterium]